MKENSKNYCREYESGDTLKAELQNCQWTYFVDTYATTRLTIEPTAPESSR